MRRHIRNGITEKYRPDRPGIEPRVSRLTYGADVVHVCRLPQWELFLNIPYTSLQDTQYLSSAVFPLGLHRVQRLLLSGSSKFKKRRYDYILSEQL